ncbi:MAG: UDP-N-acetylmuramoyl-L-alanine--D-glutamate ligase [Oscillospiraceae bacterium]|nr:UDP-N-acetylmuramoyl-L-alanine--D-glutamate ligase [Oscillospiraceae bacterium]
MTIQAYLNTLKGKRVAVIGIGVSNTPLLRLLLRAGVQVTACDRKDRDALGTVAAELESLGAELRLGRGYLDGLDHDVIFRTPGLRPDVPALAAARSRGSEVTSEMEVFFQVCPCKLAAVTGSDGKTTTTTIISELFKAAGYHTYVGGNIGKPLLADAAGMSEKDIAVVELSSFQLMTMERSPQIAVVTNLAPNHLDVHKSMEEYISAKENIFTHQIPSDKVVLNGDNSITRGFADKAPGSVTLFSRQEVLDQGVYLDGDAIWVSNAQGRRKVLPLDGILLPGVHNVENYMAAIAAVDGLVPDGIIRAFAKDFGGVEHRIELVRQLRGVSYYNDSIASSPTRTIAGLRSFHQKVILIAGGYDKNIPYDELGPEIVEHVKTLVLTGPTGPKIRAATESAPGFGPDSPVILERDTFAEAVHAAAESAQEGDIVILSPASASFDCFQNFMERGNTFKKLVHELD